MHKQNLLNELQNLIGKKTDRKGNACNSISLHFGEIMFWIDPTWRYEHEGEIIICSGDFGEPDSFESEEAYKSDFQNCCKATDKLKNSELIAFDISEQNDLALTFTGNQVLRTFHSFTEPNEENWYVSFYQKNVRYLVFPNEVASEVIT